MASVETYGCGPCRCEISMPMEGFCFWNRSTTGCITGIVSHDRKLNVVFASGSRTHVIPEERIAAEATEGLAATHAVPAAPAAPNARNRRLVRPGPGGSVVVMSLSLSDMLVPFSVEVWVG